MVWKNGRKNKWKDRNGRREKSGCDVKGGRVNGRKAWGRKRLNVNKREWLEIEKTEEKSRCARGMRREVL